MLKTIALLVAVFIALPLAALLAYAATKPDTFRIERTTRIEAPPEKIFALINDFQNWTAWSPFEMKDPDMKRIYTGAPIGKGAVYEWHGNGDIGAGRMEIVEAVPPSRIKMKLDFFTPMQAHNMAEFHMERDGDMTDVTWAMYGPQPFVGKVMSSVMDMDKMVGSEFEAGLANLKSISEN